MPKFDKHLNIRNEILNTAKTLFYEKGYHQTTFSDIALSLNITKGLIAYYFDSKTNLANIIHDEFTFSNQNKISMKMYVKMRDEFSYNPRIITSLSNIATYNMFRHDEKARRFVTEFLSQNLLFSIENDNLKMWEIHSHAVDKDRLSDTNYMKMLAMASRGASGIILVQYFTGRLDISFEQFVDFVLRIKYQIEGVPEEEINTIVTTAKNIYDKLELRFEPYFSIE